MKKVILVEEEEALHDLLRRQLPDMEVVSARTLAEFYAVFTTHGETADAIVWSAGLLTDGMSIDGIRFARSNGYGRPMYAASFVPFIRDDQIEAGIHSMIPIERKGDIADTLRRDLGLDPTP